MQALPSQATMVRTLLRQPGAAALLRCGLVFPALLLLKARRVACS
jgi:hypothetical protein